MTLAVSVVVPVYNPGPHMDALIASLQQQTLPQHRFEAIFVDDGSTDGTGERLDALAAEHENVTVIHIPNSGWPGRPRNVGTDAATGEYVLFVDNDDYLGRDALRRAHEHAVAYGSDVLAVKEVGHGRGIPFAMFEKTRPHATLGDDPLLDMLTPHKMFRRAFLQRHRIRFPEGRRRLEDHLFVMEAYFRAGVISILADYDYYHWVLRVDETNASSSRIEPVGYFGNLEEVLDLVEANTEPGAQRDRMLERWYRGKILGRLGGEALVRMPEDYREEFIAVVSDLVRRRFGPGVDDYLSLPYRVRSALFRAGRYDELLELARLEAGASGTPRLESARWEGHELVLEVSAGVHYADGSPIAYRSDGDRCLWDLPLRLDPALVTPQLLDAAGELHGGNLHGVVRARKDQASYPVPTRTTWVGLDLVNGVRSPLVRGEVRIDPRTALGGRRARSTLDVFLRFQVAGWSFTRRIRADPSLGGTDLTPAHTVGRWILRPRWTEQGNMSIAVTKVPGPRPPPGWPGSRTPSPAARLRTVMGRIRRLAGRGARLTPTDLSR